MRSVLKFRRLKFVSKELFQKSGILIGRPVSGAALEAVLCVDEDSFDKFGWGKYAANIGIGGERQHWHTIVRYVDDVFAASRWLCPKCVEHTHYFNGLLQTCKTRRRMYRQMLGSKI